MALTSRRPARTLFAATALGGLLLAQQGCTAGSEEPAPATSPAAAAGGTATTGSGDAGSAGAGSEADDAGSAAGGEAPAGDDTAILKGDRQTLIHIAEADKDWSATFEGPIVAGPGTDDGAEFRIVPSGEKYLIESLRPLEFPGRWCVVVKTEKDPSTLATTECEPTADTLWAITETGKADEKGRATYTFTNEKHGALQYDQGRDSLYVQQLGDAPPTATYSFVDRGALDQE